MNMDSVTWEIPAGELYHAGIVCCWLALVVTCWGSQLSQGVKQIFLYGKLTDAGKGFNSDSNGQVRTHPSSTSSSRSWWYTSHHFGFSLYYVVGSVLAAVVLLDTWYALSSSSVVLAAPSSIIRLFGVAFQWRNARAFHLCNRQSASSLALLSTTDTSEDGGSVLSPSSFDLVCVAKQILLPNLDCVLLSCLITIHVFRRLVETVWAPRRLQHQSFSSSNSGSALSSSSTSPKLSQQHLFVTLGGLVYYMLLILTPLFLASYPVNGQTRSSSEAIPVHDSLTATSPAATSLSHSSSSASDSWDPNIWGAILQSVSVILLRGSSLLISVLAASPLGAFLPYFPVGLRLFANVDAEYVGGGSTDVNRAGSDSIVADGLAVLPHHWTRQLLMLLANTFLPTETNAAFLAQLDSAGTSASVHNALALELTLAVVRHSFALILYAFASLQQSRAHAFLDRMRHNALRRDDRVVLDPVSAANGGVPSPCKSPCGRYSIPASGWFTLVACPHYLFEVLLYLSLAMVCPMWPGAFSPAVDVVNMNSGLGTAFSMTLAALHHYIAAVQAASLQVMVVWTQVLQANLASASNATSLLGLCTPFVMPVMAVVRLVEVLVPGPMLLIWAWVLSNLSITARATLRWYQSTFKDKFPKNRKALIPYVL